jgi:hypothetical protein
VESLDTCSDTRRAEVLPMLDLVDVAAIDVPHVFRSAVVLPELIGERDHTGHGGRAYPGSNVTTP